MFFTQSATDPLVISLLTGAPNPTCCSSSPPKRADHHPRLERMTSTFMHSWVRAEEDAAVLARAIVRLAMSYVSMPPEADHDVAQDLAR